MPIVIADPCGAYRQRIFDQINEYSHEACLLHEHQANPVGDFKVQYGATLHAAWQ